MKNLIESKQNRTIDYEDELGNYRLRRKLLDLKKIKMQEMINHQKVKKNELYFNPILQKYNDINLESKTIQHDKDELLNTIIKDKDYQLKNEQAYNIINLQDKLKGFEKHPNYPKIKKRIKSIKKVKDYTKNFNIISTLPLTVHHYDKPENRTINDYNDDPPVNRKKKFLEIPRDYDIISTRYKIFNDEKSQIDKEMNKIHTARIFYNNNDYNIICGKYYNDKKEEEFQKKRYEAQLTWGQDQIKKLPKCAKGRSNVYNLITTNIIDPVEMDRILQEEKDKKQRFGLRYKLEKYYRDKSMDKITKDEIHSIHKTSFQRYKIEDQRQFNIINLKERPYKEHSKNIKRGYETAWEAIIHGANKNSTFDQKEIYKHPNDYSDVDKVYNDFKIKRNKTLDKLKRIDNDGLFNDRKKMIGKLRIKKSVSNNKHSNSEIYKNVRNNFIDKNKFFGTIS